MNSLLLRDGELAQLVERCNRTAEVRGSNPLFSIVVKGLTLMTKNFQKTNLHRNVVNALEVLENWSFNPWRKYSLLIIILLIGFVFGSSIGTINGVLALMDPIGAFFVVALLEFMVRLRRNWPSSKGYKIALEIIDTARIGLLYGLLMEGFKLL